MNCQECHHNPATLHFTKIMNGKKTEMHLCEQCAWNNDQMFSGQNGFSMNNLLSGLLNFDHPLGETKTKHDQKINDIQCDNCGLSYHQFSKMGRFGCAHCYKTFHEKLEPILKRVHSGNTKHGGKIPKRIGGSIKLQQELKELKVELQQAIASEEFEKAAEIRDQVRNVEEKIRTYGEGEQ